MDKGAGDSQLLFACDLYFAFTHFGVCFANPKLENQVSYVILWLSRGLACKTRQRRKLPLLKWPALLEGMPFSVILVCAWRLSELINLLVLNFLPKTRGCGIYKSKPQDRYNP